MSKIGKLKSRLFSMPKDFSWDELVVLMTHYGFSLLKTKGSGRKFINPENRILACHEPHPSNIIKKYILTEVKALIEELDFEAQQDSLDLEGDD